jgi:hypothetical protein
MPSGALYRGALVKNDVSENVSSPSSGFLRVIGLSTWFEIELHATKSQKASTDDTAVKASQKTVFFDH